MDKAKSFFLESGIDVDPDAINAAIKSIGATFFVDYYDLFDDNYFLDSDDPYYKAFEETDWKQSTKKNRIRICKQIFTEGVVFEVLICIIMKHCGTKLADRAAILLQRVEKENAMQEIDEWGGRVPNEFENYNF